MMNTTRNSSIISSKILPSFLNVVNQNTGGERESHVAYIVKYWECSCKQWKHKLLPSNGTSSNMADILLCCIPPVDHRWEQEAKVREDLSYNTNLVQIKGSSKFCNIAWQMGSSGIRTPTCLLFAYLVEEPCLMHCLGNCLVAGKIKVYCRWLK